MGMGMTDALYTLATWLSPAYPVGAYSYSHGLEWAIGSGAVTSRQTLRDWIGDCLEHGAGRTDAILLASAWRDPGQECDRRPCRCPSALARTVSGDDGARYRLHRNDSRRLERRADRSGRLSGRGRPGRFGA